MGSAAPVRDNRMQPIGRELVAVLGRHARTTAVAKSDLLDALCDGQVPKWTSHSPRKPPLAPMGRHRQFVTIGCSRLPPSLSRSSIGIRERPLLTSPTFSAAWAKVKFQGRPVVRWENRRRLLWVGSTSSRTSDAAVQPRSCPGRWLPPANDRCPGARISRHDRRTTVSTVDRSLDRKTATGAFGSAAPVRSLDQQTFGRPLMPAGIAGQ